MRQTIAVDIDDVLSASAEGFALYSNKTWGSNITANDYTEEWAVAWGVPLREAKRRAKLFHEAGVVGTYRHHNDALPVLHKLATRFDLIVVTSRRSVLKPETDAWLKRHFDGVFKAIHYAGIWDGQHDVMHALKQSKAMLCHELGADYLIDDQLKHCFGAAECGMRALLFGNYTWNKTDKALPKNVKRVDDWIDVERYFDGTR